MIHLSFGESLLLGTLLFGDGDRRQVLLLLRIEFRQLFLQFCELGFLLVELCSRFGNVGASSTVRYRSCPPRRMDLLLLRELCLAFRQSVLITRLDLCDNLLFLLQLEPQCFVTRLDRGQDDISAFLDLVQTSIVLMRRRVSD
jgi:hypothetical protein